MYLASLPEIYCRYDVRRFSMLPKINPKQIYKHINNSHRVVGLFGYAGGCTFRSRPYKGQSHIKLIKHVG